MSEQLIQTDELLVTCTALTKRYGSKTALNRVNLQLKRGRIVGLLGPNGSGTTTLIKLLCGMPVGPATKALVSYLPDRMYFADWMKASDLLDLFNDFYSDFDRNKATAMCQSLGVVPSQRLKTMSKGTKEKVQLVLVMARKASLYLLDEPIAGVDPAARDYILNTILTNYNEEGCVMISTHLISDIEQVLSSMTAWMPSGSGRARAWTLCSARSFGRQV